MLASVQRTSRRARGARPPLDLARSAPAERAARPARSTVTSNSRHAGGRHGEPTRAVRTVPSLRAMERLRTLSEAECYERCYGWRYTEDTVKVLREEPRERRRRRELRMLLELRLDAREPKRPDGRRPGRPRARVRVVFCGINPGRASAAAGARVRESAERLLAPPPRGRVHAAPASSRSEQHELLDARHRADERRPPNDARLERSSRGRLRGCARAARGDRASSSSPASSRSSARPPTRASFRERPEHGLQERTLGETRALRPAVDLAGERRRPVGRAASLVSGAARARLD